MDRDLVPRRCGEERAAEESDRRISPDPCGLSTSATKQDLSGYFARIGYTGPTDPTLPTLTALVTAHGNTIPFENLNPLMGIPVGDLLARALFDKLIHRRRGGYCYKQNGLLCYVLAELGFDVDARAGRVVWMSPDGLSAALVTHDARWTLRGRNLAVHRSDGHSERIRLDDSAQVLDALTNRFGIDLDGLGDVAARVDAVLDT